MRKVKIFRTEELFSEISSLEAEVNKFIEDNRLQIYDLFPTQSSIKNAAGSRYIQYTILLDYQIP